MMMGGRSTGLSGPSATGSSEKERGDESAASVIHVSPAGSSGAEEAEPTERAGANEPGAAVLRGRSGSSAAGTASSSLQSWSPPSSWDNLSRLESQALYTRGSVSLYRISTRPSTPMRLPASSVRAKTLLPLNLRRCQGMITPCLHGSGPTPSFPGSNAEELYIQRADGGKENPPSHGWARRRCVRQVSVAPRSSACYGARKLQERLVTPDQPHVAEKNA